MSLIGLALNLLLATLLAAALGMGWRLNGRLKHLRQGHEGFAKAVAERNAAAVRAEQGLADLRAASDAATDELVDRIEKGRALAMKLERLIDRAPAPRAEVPRAETPRAEPARVQPAHAEASDEVVDTTSLERRLGSLLAWVRDARPDRLRRDMQAPPPRRQSSIEDDLFDDEPLTLRAVAGARR